MIQSTTLRDLINRELHKITGGTVHFAKVELTLFPRPHIAVEQLRFSIPSRISVNAKTLEVMPDLTALLQANFTASEIRIISGDIRVHLNADAGTKESSAKRTEASELVEKIQAWLNWATKFGIRIDNSRLKLVKKGQVLIQIDAISASVQRSSEFFVLDFHCSANEWNNLRVNARFNPRSMLGTAEIRVQQLNPKSLHHFVQTPSPLRIVDGSADIEMELGLKGPDAVTLVAQGSLPLIELTTGRDRVQLRNKGFALEARLNDEIINLSLRDVTMLNPDLQDLSAQLMMNRSAPDRSLTISAASIDVASTRKILEILGSASSTANSIVQAFRSGQIRQLQLDSKAGSWRQLLDPAHLNLAAVLTDANLLLSGIALDLKKLNGNLKMSRGRLIANNLRARLENSAATDGVLQLTLNREPIAIDLNFAVEAAAADLLPVVRAVADDTEADRSWSKLQEIEGRIAGKVQLSGPLGALRSKIEAGQIQLSVRHEIIPFPLRIDSGRFKLDNAELRIDGWNGDFGRSTFTDLSGNVNIGAEFPVRLSLTDSALDLAQLQGWLVSMEPLQKLAQYQLGKSSRVRIDSAVLNGPLLHPDQLRYSLSGRLDQIEFANPTEPNQSLQIETGKFQVNNDLVQLSSLAIRTAGNTLTTKGTLRPTGDIWRFDLDVHSPGFDWNRLDRAYKSAPEEKNQVAGTHSDSVPLTGKIRFRTDRFQWHDLVWSPVQANISIGDRQKTVSLTEARLCGISTPLRAQSTPAAGWRLEVLPNAKDQSVNKTLECLFSNQYKIDGRFNLNGAFNSVNGHPGSLADFAGNLEIDAQDGRIYKDRLIFNILEYLNAIEFIAGKQREWQRIGVPYESAKAEIRLENGLLHFNRFSLTGPTIELVGMGHIDVEKRTIEARFLVAPLRTASRILKYVPLVGGVLEDLISVPIQVRGPLRNPQIKALSPSAVGGHLLGLFKRTVGVPVQLIQPGVSGEK